MRALIEHAVWRGFGEIQRVGRLEPMSCVRKTFFKKVTDFVTVTITSGRRCGKTVGMFDSFKTMSGARASGGMARRSARTRLTGRKHLDSVVMKIVTISEFFCGQRNKVNNVNNNSDNSNNNNSRMKNGAKSHESTKITACSLQVADVFA